MHHACNHAAATAHHLLWGATSQHHSHSCAVATGPLALGGDLPPPATAAAAAAATGNGATQQHVHSVAGRDRRTAHHWQAMQPLLSAAALCTAVMAMPRPEDRTLLTGPSSVAIPTRPLAGGTRIPMLLMGGNQYAQWFALAGRGAAIQTFWGYHNEPSLAPQIAKTGRENVYISSGLPCGGIGDPASDVPGEPMNASAAAAFIDSDLAQLKVSHVDLLLMHHRCHDAATTREVWGAMEAAKKSGKAKAIGVSNFNTYDLQELWSWEGRSLPIEVNEAHFTVGEIDTEALGFMAAHHIVPVSFSSLAASVPMNNSVITRVALAHSITNAETMLAYIHQKNVSVLTSFDPKHLDWAKQDLGIFRTRLSAAEMAALDALQTGRRTCTDCFTVECEACAAALKRLGCPIGSNFPVWGRDNPSAGACMACAQEHKSAVAQACNPGRGETVETLVPKACGE